MDGSIEERGTAPSQTPTIQVLRESAAEATCKKGRFSIEETVAIGKLTYKQLLYTKMRPICRTATEAVKRAGYSKKSAKSQAQDLKGNIGVQALLRAYAETSDVSPDDMIEMKGDPKDILARNVNKILAKLWAQIFDPLAKPKDTITACKEWLYMAGLKPTEHFTVESRHPELAKLSTNELKERAAELVEDVKSRMPVIVPKKDAG